MVKSMGHAECGAEEFGCLPLAKWAGDKGSRVLRGDRLGRFVPERVRVLQVFDDLSFGLEGRRTVVFGGWDGRLVAGDRAPQQVISGGHVPYLFGECLHSLVFTAGDVETDGSEI